MLRAQRSFSLILSMALSVGLYAQLWPNVGLTPAQLVQNVLLGNGVQAFNVKYNGINNPPVPQQGSGSFNVVSSNLGLDGGVILASGFAQNVNGPESDFMSDSPGTGSDPDLVAISGGVINDKAVLEFDFIPTGDSLSFRYVFASEEYPEWVCSFNDVFGFFLSGPGINGPYTNNAINIALVPGTTTPVGINTINNGDDDIPNNPTCPAVNPQYYVTNNGGTTVVFDGFTVVLTARALVTCGLTYHIKLAIGDALDTGFDSAVFLEAGSFATNLIDLGGEIEFGGQDSSLFEGCGVASIVISRPGDTTSTETVEFVTAGTATEGGDYSPIPDSFTFTPGQDSIVVSIEAFLDGVNEGPELVELYAIVNTPCGDDTATISFYITDAPLIELEMTDDATLPTCLDSAFVGGTATGGYGTLFYDWNTGPADGTTGAWMQPDQTTTYVLTVTDECGVNSATGDVTVTVPYVPPLVVAALPDTTVLCPETPVTLHTVVVGGTAPYTYQWSNALGAQPSASVAPPVTQSWTVTVTDLCGRDTSDAVTVTVLYDTITVFIAPDTNICAGDTAFLVAYASRGTGLYTYAWTDGWTDPVHDVSPYQTSGYAVEVTDECGISAYDATVVFVNDPSAQFMHNAGEYVAENPVQFIDQSVGATQWHWDFGAEDLTSEEQYPTIEFPEAGTYTVTLTITDEIGCVDSTFQLIFIDPQAYFYLPTAFSPDGDGVNETFGITGEGIAEFQMRIFDRWGEEVFTTDDPAKAWDGTYGDEVAKTGVYVVWFRLRDVLDVIHEHRSQVTLLK